MNIIKYTLATLAIITSINVQAFEEKCTNISELARDVMISRQGGIPMSKMIELAEGDELIIYVVEEAYNNYSVMPSPEYKQEYISKFSDDFYKRCYNANKHAQEQEKKMSKEVKGQRVSNSI